MRPCLLLVDDDSTTLKILPAVLGVHFPDLTIQSCSSGADALSFLFAKPSFVVVSDIRMPGMDGFELLTRVKASRPEIPVILTTAEADISIATQAFNVGAFDFFAKPYNAEDLARSIRLAVCGYALARQMQAARQRLIRWQHRTAEGASWGQAPMHKQPCQADPVINAIEALSRQASDLSVVRNALEKYAQRRAMRRMEPRL